MLFVFCKLSATKTMALSMFSSGYSEVGRGYVATAVDKAHFFHRMKNRYQPIKKTQKPLYFSGLH